MKNRLLKIGLTLSLIGSLSAITLCIITLFDPFFFPGFYMFFSIIILFSGFVVTFVDCQNDFRRVQKISEDVESLTVIFKELQKKNILNQMLVIILLSESQRTIKKKADL
ncbi:MAG: hypothetical protein ACK5MK_14330 [Dysgonomonas sp.]